jgi:hypothetical protein
LAIILENLLQLILSVIINLPALIGKLRGESASLTLNDNTETHSNYIASVRARESTNKTREELRE